MLSTVAEIDMKLLQPSHRPVRTSKPQIDYDIPLDLDRRSHLPLGYRSESDHGYQQWGCLHMRWYTSYSSSIAQL
jgi:hypothetical protein